MKNQNIFPVSDAEMDEVRTYRDYYEGEFPVKLTRRQEDYLMAHSGSKKFTFGVNHCRIVVNAVVSRMAVTSIFALAKKTPAQIQRGDGDTKYEGGTRLLEWWAERNSFLTLQEEVHTGMVRDGKAFVLVEWDDDDNAPRLSYVPAYSRDENSPLGGLGGWVVYDESGKIVYTAREFVDEDGTRYREYHYKDRVVLKSLGRGGWKTVKTESNEGWRGQLIGRRLVVFDQGQSELRPIIGLQDLINKTWVDLAAAADDSAFRTFFAFGWYPTTDGRPPRKDRSNLMAILPGSFLATMRSPSVAGVKVVDPASLTGLLDMEERLTTKIAQITGTPISMFQSTRLTPNAETLKEMDAPLRAKVLKKQTVAGDGWRRVWQIALRLAASRGIGYIERDTMMNCEVSVTWAIPEARITDKDVDVAVSMKNDLHVPLDVVLSRLGFTPDVVQRAVNSEGARAESVARRIAADLTSLKPPVPLGGGAQGEEGE